MHSAVVCCSVRCSACVSVSALCSGVATVALQYLMDTTDSIDGSGLASPRPSDLLRYCVVSWLEVG